MIDLTLLVNFATGVAGLVLASLGLILSVTCRPIERWTRSFFIASFFIMFMIHVFWTSESIWSELLFYLLDILTTVFLSEAVTILSLERKEKLAVVKNLRDSFSAIHFESSQ